MSFDGFFTRALTQELTNNSKVVESIKYTNLLNKNFRSLFVKIAKFIDWPHRLMPIIFPCI